MVVVLRGSIPRLGIRASRRVRFELGTSEESRQFKHSMLANLDRQIPIGQTKRKPSLVRRTIAERTGLTHEARCLSDLVLVQQVPQAANRHV